ncbi:MAG TPA: HPF/RaiA family ribosome-associated protein [Terriglobales bacterium]|nr:HPF/RaiA family ribosome-associated protein [Terriglobales bacterium]
METVQITFRGIDSSAAIEAKVRERAAKLERLYPRITSCRVAVEAPHGHHHKGKIFHVRIDLTVPQHELVVSRDPAQNHAHEDVYVAIRDAFEAAERQLEDLNKRQQNR